MIGYNCLASNGSLARKRRPKKNKKNSFTNTIEKNHTYESNLLYIYIYVIDYRPTAPSPPPMIFFEDVDPTPL